MEESSDAIPLQIVEGSHFLGHRLGLERLVELAVKGDCSKGEIKSEVLNKDLELLHSSCLEHTSTQLAAKIAAECSWLKLWDAALDIGTPGTCALQNLYREMTRPSHGPSPCPKCDISGRDISDKSTFEHYINNHLSLISTDEITRVLTAPELDLSLIVNHFRQCVL